MTQYEQTEHSINPSHYDWQPGDYGELRVTVGEDKTLYFRIEDDYGTLTPSYDLHDGLNYYSTRNTEDWPHIEQYVPRNEWIDEINAGARFVGRIRFLATLPRKYCITAKGIVPCGPK